MEISIDRRVAIQFAGPQKDHFSAVRFAVAVRSLDTHTHGELTRGDQQAIRDELAKAADAVEAILRKQA